MSKTLYKIINPVVKKLLGSPFHGLMSRNTILLEFKGRKSGKTLTTPISYRAVNGHLHCFTEKTNKWWQNLRGGDDIVITLRGQRVTGKPSVFSDGSEKVLAALHDLLVVSPRDAAHAEVKFDNNGHPIAADVARASERLVLINIELLD